MNKKLINEIDRIHELLFESQLLNEIIGQLSSAAVKSTIRNIIKNVIKKSIKSNLDTILKKSPKYLDNFMQVDELFKKSQDEIIDALKKSDKQIADLAKNNPDLLKMSVRTHFKELVDAESKAITKELVDDLGKVAAKSAPPIKIPKPGDVILSTQFSDDMIDWSKVKNAKSMTEYNKVITDAIKSGNYSNISREGFEKYGIPNFREFLEKGKDIDKKQVFFKDGTWYFQLKKDLPSGLISTSTSSLKKELPGQLTSSNTLKKLTGRDTSDFARILGKDEIIPKETIELIFKNSDEVNKVIQKVTPESAGIVKNTVAELADPAKLKKGWMGNFNFEMKRAQLIGNLKSWGVLNSAGKLTNVGWLSLTALGLGTVAMYGALQETGVDTTEVSPEIKANVETDNSDYEKLAQERISYWDSQKGGAQYGSSADTGFGRVLPAQQARIKELLSKAGISGEELNQTTINQLYKFLQG